MSGHDIWDEAAIGWLARNKSGTMTAPERARHATWLLSDPRARAAWDRARLGWDMAGLLAGDPTITSEIARIPKAGFQFKWLAASFILFALVAGAAMLSFPRPPAETRIAISAGASPKTRTLSDGSTIMLDAGSEISVGFLPNSRRLSLPHGHAFFRVARDRTRPFTVDLKGLTVTALGTAFDIKNGSAARTISLTEGRILVQDKAGRTAVMDAGSQMHVDASGWHIVRKDLSVERAWASHRHLFDRTALSKAAATMNGYTTRMIIIDPGLSDRPVSGVFAFGDTEGFARAIAALNGDIAVSIQDGVVHMTSPAKKISATS